MMKVNLLHATLGDVSAALQSGSLSSVELVKAYLQRIEANNIRGLGLRAAGETGAEDKLLDVAHKLDEERARGISRGPLHGIPLLIKESINTHPEMGMHTTGGTVALLSSRVQGNAPVVDNLLKAGAIILGKASMTVMNAWYGSDIPNAWSPRFGQGLSAYGWPGYDPSGSSNGCAVGLSAGFCAGAIGVCTSGSIRAGIYAMRPSSGLIDASGIMPVSPRLDTPGAMGKCTSDVALLLDVITRGEKGFVKAVAIAESADLSTLRLGVPRKHFVASDNSDFGPAYAEDVKAEALAIFDRVLAELRPAVAEDPADIPRVEKLWGDGGSSTEEVSKDSRSWNQGPTQRVVVTEYFDAINEYLSQRQGGEIKSLADLIAWNEAHPAFPSADGPPQDTVLRECQQLAGKWDDDFDRAVAELEAMSAAIDRVFDRSNLDALLFPAGLGAAGTRALAVAAVKGYPMAHVPVALMSTDEPCGIYLIAKHGDDARLLKAMALVERAVGIHPVPNSLAE